MKRWGIIDGLSMREIRVLRRACECPDYVWFRGFNDGAAIKLTNRGLLKQIAMHRAGGHIYQKTPEAAALVKEAFT